MTLVNTQRRGKVGGHVSDSESRR